MGTTTALPVALQTLANDYVREELWSGADDVSAADFARDYLDVAIADVDAAGIARIVRALGEAYETVSECPECDGRPDPRAQLPWDEDGICEECGGRGRLHERPAIVLGHLTLEAAFDVAAE